MQSKLTIFLLLLAIVPMCLAYWLSPGYNQQHVEIAAPLCFLLSLAFSFSKLATKQVCITIFVGIMTAKIIKIVIDCYYDPTSHNLLPFELVIYGVIFSFFILTGAGLGKLILFIKAAVDKHKKVNKIVGLLMALLAANNKITTAKKSSSKQKTIESPQQ